MNSRFSVSQVIKDGAQKTFDHIGVLIKGLFFAFLAIIIVAVGLAIANLGFIAAFWSMFPHLQKVKECGANTACIQAVIHPLIELFKGDVIMLILSLATISIGFSYVSLGYVNYTLCVYDRGTAGFADLLPSLGRVVKIVRCSLLSWTANWISTPSDLPIQLRCMVLTCSGQPGSLSRQFSNSSA